jgi:hypothetical protein
LLLHSHAGLRGKPSQGLGHAISRAIIDDNDLVGRINLFKATPDRSAYVFCAIKH